MNIRVKMVRSSVDKQGPEKEKSRVEIQTPGALPTFKTHINKTERDYFEKLISLTNGSIKEACRISGLSRSRLYAILNKHNITRQYYALTS